MKGYIRSFITFITGLTLSFAVWAQESTTTVIEKSGLEKAESSLTELLVKMGEIVDPLIVGSLGTVLGLVIAGKRALKLLKIIKPLASIFIIIGKIATLIGETLLKVVAKVEE